MKAISLWQPWASAIALDLKHFETRGWKPPAALVGQPLAIHAAKKQDWQTMTRWVQHRLGLHPSEPPPDPLDLFTSATVKGAIREFQALPFGAVVCLCRVVKVWQVTDVMSALKHVGDRESTWGDYSAGRYYWELQKFYTFDKPIPCVGKQGLFDWTIPQEWIDDAAADAGMPGMAEIWKAVHR